MWVNDVLIRDGTQLPQLSSLKKHVAKDDRLAMLHMRETQDGFAKGMQGPRGL